jgi:hypothetical protein
MFEESNLGAGLCRMYDHGWKRMLADVVANARERDLVFFSCLLSNDPLRLLSSDHDCTYNCFVTKLRLVKFILDSYPTLLRCTDKIG